MTEILNRAALSGIFKGAASAFDGVVTDDAFVHRLADNARAWLTSKGAAIPAPLVQACTQATPAQDIAVIAAAASLATAHGGWRWWDSILTSIRS